MRAFISWNYHFKALFWQNFNFVEFRAYFGHFYLVNSAKNKIAFLQQKECSNQKIEENKSVLEFDFLWKSKCASLYFDFWFLDEPYWLATRYIRFKKCLVLTKYWVENSVYWFRKCLVLTKYWVENSVYWSSGAADSLKGSSSGSEQTPWYHNILCIIVEFGCLNSDMNQSNLVLRKTILISR